MPKVWTKSDKERISVSINEYGRPIVKKTTSTFNGTNLLRLVIKKTQRYVKLLASVYASTCFAY